MIKRGFDKTQVKAIFQIVKISDQPQFPTNFNIVNSPLSFLFVFLHINLRGNVLDWRSSSETLEFSFAQAYCIRYRKFLSFHLNNC